MATFGAPNFPVPAASNPLFSQSGLFPHGYLYLVLLVSIAVLLYLGARAGWDRLPISVSLAHTPVMLVASLVSSALVLVAFSFKPGGSSWAVAGLALLPHSSRSPRRCARHSGPARRFSRFCCVASSAPRVFED